MKRLLLAASALIAIPAIAAAQQDDHRDNRDAHAKASAPATARAQPSRSVTVPTARGGSGYNGAAQRSFTPRANTYARPEANAYARPGYNSYARPGVNSYARPGVNTYARPNTQVPAQGANGQRNWQGQHADSGQRSWQGANGQRNWQGQHADAGQRNWQGQGGWRGDRGDFGREGWWRGHRGFEGYEGRREGFWFAPGWGYYQVEPRWADYDWGVGAFVPYQLRSYYVSDPYDYGLPPAPWGCRWVYLGDQLVLIDMRTGLVVQVAGSY